MLLRWPCCFVEYVVTLKMLLCWRCCYVQDVVPKLFLRWRCCYVEVVLTSKLFLRRRCCYVDDVVSLTKCKAPGPESFEETVHHIAKKVDPKRHVAAADGSPSLQKSATSLGVASAEGLSTISKRNLDAETSNLLQRLAKRKKTTLWKNRDNVAESCRLVYRPMEKTGTTRWTDKLEHRHILSAFYIHRNPGLQSVLEALKCHRHKVNGACAPMNASKTALWMWREKRPMCISPMVLWWIMTFLCPSK